MLGHSYIPSDQIRNIITRASVDEELSKWRFEPRKYFFALRGIGVRIESSTAQATRLVPSSQCHERQRRKDEKMYRVVFAILLYLDRASEIWSFVEEGICDDDIPLRKVVPPLSRRHRDLRRRNDPQTPLRCFQKWKLAALIAFEKHQWMFLEHEFQSPSGQTIHHYDLEPSRVVAFTI